MPKASVKIMRSYDYCHFEICLGSDEDMSLDQIDNMRKDAARLVDKATSQYIIAKEKANAKLHLDCEKKQLMRTIENIKTKPENEWTAEERAKIKALEDHEYWEQYDYNYED